MELVNIIQILESAWAFLAAICAALLYKLIPYLKTKIFKYEYYNIDFSFFLVEYELIGTLVSQIVALFLTVALGESDGEILIYKEFFYVLIIVTLVYIAGIILIVDKKTEKTPYKYLKNILWGMAIYLLLMIQLLLSMENVLSEELNNLIHVVVVMVLILQCMENIKKEQAKNVKYKVVTNKNKYSTIYEPVKRGNYYYIRIVDKSKNEIKRMQIPEEKIEKIEYIIENIKEVEKESEGKENAK